jgi:DNA-directed RNA polymerase subunit K/omega
LSIPLDKLIDKDVNVYEMTCVAIKKAENVAAAMAAKREVISEDEPVEKKEEEEKVVSQVLTAVLNDEIEYTPAEK